MSKIHEGFKRQYSKEGLEHGADSLASTHSLKELKYLKKRVHKTYAKAIEIKKGCK